MTIINWAFELEQSLDYSVLTASFWWLRFLELSKERNIEIVKRNKIFGWCDLDDEETFDCQTRRLLILIIYLWSSALTSIIRERLINITDHVRLILHFNTWISRQHCNITHHLCVHERFLWSKSGNSNFIILNRFQISLSLIFLLHISFVHSMEIMYPINVWFQLFFQSKLFMYLF